MTGTEIDIEDVEELLEAIADFDEIGDLSQIVALASSFMIVFAVVGLILAVVSLIMYLIESYGIYVLAKKVGHSKAWLAWIPYARTWLTFNIPTNTFKILAINATVSTRTIAFLIFLGVTLFKSNFLWIFGLIPYIGAAIVVILKLVIMVFLIFMKYPMYNDIFLMFYPEQTAQGYAIASVICSIFAPIIPSILFVLTATKAPRELVVDSKN